MLCAHVLQCGSGQRINDYGFLCVIFPCIGVSVQCVKLNGFAFV